MNSPLRVGMVGCGGISSVYLKALSSNKECNIVGLCDLNESRAKDKATQFGVPNVYTDLATMLSKQKLDAAFIMTPPQSHAALTIQSLEAGCHVLVQKPMSMTVSEADQMITVAKRHGLKLGVAHTFLFIPAVQEALSAVRKREIGQLVGIDALVSTIPSSPQPKWIYDLPGGYYGEIIPHPLYVELAFLGKITQVFSTTGTANEPSRLLPFSDLWVIMNSKEGTGRLWMSTRVRSPYEINWIRVIGTEKSLFVIVPTSTIIVEDFGNKRDPLSRAMLNIGLEWSLLKNTLIASGKAIFGKLKTNITSEIVVRNFLESVRNDTNPLVSPEEGREVIRVIEMIWQAIGLKA